MSAELARQQALRLIRSIGDIEPGPSILREIVASTDTASTQLIYDAAYYAHNNLQTALDRAIPVLFHTTIIHLADDIADGDYIDHPVSQGVTAVYTLLHLFNIALAKTNINEPVLFKTLAEVGLWQHQEIATPRWDLEKSKNAATGLNGRQFEAYFEIAALGSDSYDSLKKAGFAYGVAAHFMNDIIGDDARLYHLPPDDRKALIKWALTLIEQSPLPFQSGKVYTDPVTTTLHREMLK